MNKMKDPNKKFVVFHDKTAPNMKLLKKQALKDNDFDGFVYDRDHSEETEIWVKK
jgi:hypothetical protein